MQGVNGRGADVAGRGGANVGGGGGGGGGLWGVNLYEPPFTP